MAHNLDCRQQKRSHSESYFTGRACSTHMSSVALPTRQHWRKLILRTDSLARSYHDIASLSNFPGQHVAEIRLGPGRSGSSPTTSVPSQMTHSDTPLLPDLCFQAQKLTQSICPARPRPTRPHLQSGRGSNHRRSNRGFGFAVCRFDRQYMKCTRMKETVASDSHPAGL